MVYALNAKQELDEIPELLHKGLQYNQMKNVGG